MVYEGDIVYLLGGRFYCAACVRGALIAAGVYVVIPPGTGEKNGKKGAEAVEKQLHFKERTDFV